MPAPKKGTASQISDNAIMLWLPSCIPTELRSSSCLEELAVKEIVLRVADCSDSLHNIRRCLRELSAISRYKSKNVEAQRVQTRAIGTVKALHDKHDRYVARYRRSRVAWLALDPGQAFEDGKWKMVLRDLKKTDLTYPGNDQKTDDESDGEVANGTGSNAKKQRGERNKCLSWIWCVQTQDTRDFPGLDSSASEEDVYKRRMIYQ
jgi:hypothetical protein